VSAAEAAAAARPVSAAEATALFADLAAAPAIVLAVSGGPDSMALLLLAARWRAGRKRGPKLLAVTIDHALRPESAREANEVKRVARRLGVVHRTLRWTGKKPATGLQEKARQARYRLLAGAAARDGASHLLTAHTLDDQAETVLMRLLRGSGMAGLGGMARVSPVPACEEKKLLLLRPLLDLPKARLIATLKAAGIPFAEDPSNDDPRFTRVRMRTLLPALAGEGLDAQRLALLARRMRRAEAALETAADAAAEVLSCTPWSNGAAISLDAAGFKRLPPEIALRLLARAVTSQGNEGPVELAKSEALLAALLAGPASGRFRRTLAGAVVTLAADRLLVERAPPRRRPRAGSGALTTRKRGPNKGRKGR
jgi:tRNA(Ile)-lysidine synthase